MTGIAASGPMSPSPSTAVPSVTTATVLPFTVRFQARSRVLVDRLRHARDARRVGHREVVARLDRNGAVHADLAAQVQLERPVGDAWTLTPSTCWTAATTASPCAASTHDTVMSRTTSLPSTRTRSIAPRMPPWCPIALATSPNEPGRCGSRTRIVML